MPGILQMFVAGNPTGGYQISNSLRFRSSASAYLNRTPASAGNRQIWTISLWKKFGDLTASSSKTFSAFDGTNIQYFEFGSNKINFGIYNGASQVFQLVSTSVYRDPSAWYHFVISFDSTQATASNRVKIYVNGLQVTAFDTANYPSQNYSGIINSTNAHALAAAPPGTYFATMDGYLADINFIDGQALDPTSFGAFSSTTGVWTPKAYTGTYGTNGFYLKFNNGTSTTTLGYDASGNSNNWTTNNVSLTAGSTYDWMIDSPTSYAGSSYGVGNYAVLNPLSTTSTLSNGNLTFSATATYTSAFSSIGMTTGKWYFEATAGSFVSDYLLGISSDLIASNYVGGTAYSYGYEGAVGAKYNNSSFSTAGYSSYTNGDVISVAFDADNGKVFFAKNGTWQESGNPVTGVNPAYSGLTRIPYFFGCSTGIAGSWAGVNFGQRPFAFSPPSGYKSLCTYNLPTPTIQQGNKFMDATLWTGNGSSQSIVNAAGFQPDFVWGKSRSNAYQNILVDSIRGASTYLQSSTTAAEATNSAVISAITSTGFTVGSDATLNGSGATNVAWQWKASNAAAVSNTAGSITSQVSANTTAGFSVVTYTGNLSSNGTATVGHGLGVAPSLIIAKARSATSSWVVHHISLTTPSYVMLLDSTSAQFDTSASGGTVVAPTSSVFTTNYTTGYNINGVTQVAYCFAAIPGYSAFGSYTGNGSSDGPFVYLGFRPRWMLVKRSSTGGNYWILIDTARGTYNVNAPELYPNASDAENTGSKFDLLSNGFKLRDSAAAVNNSGDTYVYACFAENPFTVALAR